MARPLRIEYEGVVYHVTSRGNAGKPVFRDDEGREIGIHYSVISKLLNG